MWQCSHCREDRAITTQTYRAVQVSAVGQFELVERAVTSPPPGEVRIRVEACGICHSDEITVLGLLPGIRYPRVPGHEVVGKIDALGDGVNAWRIGQRVGVGYFGGPDLHSAPYREDDFTSCRQKRTTGIATDGGYSEVMFASELGLVAIPDEIRPQDAAPLVCAGAITYNALRKSDARCGDVVAVQGIGGLGHLALQFARSMGMRVAAIGRGAEKEEASLRLGALSYIDEQKTSAVSALQTLGGAKVILATAATNKVAGKLVAGLASGGTLVIVGAGGDGPMQITPADLIYCSGTITGALAGAMVETEDALAFSVRHDIRPMVETVPLDRAAEAYYRMMRGEARFRMVLVMET